MTDKPEPDKVKKKNVRVGALTLLALVILFLLVSELRSRQEVEEEKNYLKARLVLKNYISNPTFGDCTEIEKVRDLIKRNLSKTKARAGLINSKAVAYDLVLKEGHRFCRQGEREILPSNTKCENIKECTEKGKAFFLRGDFDKSAKCFKAGLVFEDSRGIREMLRLITQIQND